MRTQDLNFTHYHNAGFPYIWIETFEADRLIRDMTAMIPEEEEVFQWDMVDGIYEARSGKHIEIERSDDDDDKDEGPKAQDMIDLLVSRDGPAIMFAVNFHFVLDERVNPEERAEIIQKLVNARDELQRKGNCLVVVCPVLEIPLELSKIFQTIEFDLPTKEKLREVFEQQAKNAKLPESSNDHMESVLESAVGLTAHEAENAAALSIAAIDALDPKIISHLRADMIRQSATLEVGRFEKTLDDLKGMDAVKGYILDSLKSDKYKGILLIGMAGSGKTELAKTIGAHVERDTIIADINKIMSEGKALVGQAETKAYQSTKIIDSQGSPIVMFDEIEKGHPGARAHEGDGGSRSGVGAILLKWLSDRPRGKAYVIATCNAIDKLPPAWKRAGRWDAIFFVDFPDKETRDEILDHYCKIHDVDNFDAPEMEGWTGAEIEQMVLNASMLNRTLKDASMFVTPIVEVDPEGVKELEDWAFPKGRDKKGRCVLATTRKNPKDKKIDPSGSTRRIKRDGESVN